MEMNKKYLSSNFTVTSRDEHQFIFRNKTNAPDLGKYNPRMNSVDAKTKITKFDDHKKYSEEAKERKLELSFKKVHICDHVVKGITNSPEKKRPVKKG